MKDFKPNNRFNDRGGDRFPRHTGGRPNFDGKPSFHRGNDRGGSGQMFQATCAQCGKVCEVPFKPNGKKPVYCNDCFGKPTPSEGFARKEYTPKPEYKKPFQTHDTNRYDNHNNDDMKRSLEAINTKLDKLITLMGSKPETPAVEVPKKKSKVSKVVDTKALKKAVTKATKKVTKKKSK